MLTHWLKVLTHPRSNKSGRCGKSKSEGRSVLTVHSYTVSAAVPWYMWCTKNVDMHRTALSIMMLRIVKVSTSAKSTHEWVLDLKSIYVLRNWYQF